MAGGFCFYSTVGPLINKLGEKTNFGSMIIHIPKMEIFMSVAIAMCD